MGWFREFRSRWRLRRMSLEDRRDLELADANKQYRAALKTAGTDDFKTHEVEVEHQFDTERIWESYLRARDTPLLRRATRLRIPLPTRPSKKYNEDLQMAVYDTDENWTTDEYGSDLHLTEQGYDRIRKHIREEELARDERKHRWLALVVQFLTALAGLVGALTGLVAVGFVRGC